MASVISELGVSCTSWVRKYFEVKDVMAKDKKTGNSALVSSDVCVLPVTNNSTVMCGAVYKRNLKNGTKTLQRHLLLKHRENAAVLDEIKARSLTFPKVRNHKLIIKLNTMFCYVLIDGH